MSEIEKIKNYQTMFRFDIDEILEELEGKTIMDKLRYLNDLNEKLDEAIGQIDAAFYEICDDYAVQVSKRLKSPVSQFIPKYKLDDKVEICKDKIDRVYYKVVNNDCTFAVSEWCDEGDLLITLNVMTKMPEERKLKLLNNLAQTIGQCCVNEPIDGISEPSISISVSEDDIEEKVKEVIGKICRV